MQITETEIQLLIPDNFTLTEEMGWVPVGWEAQKCFNQFEILGGGTPSTKNAEYWKGENICWTTPRGLLNNSTKVLLDTERKITELGLEKISSGLLPIDTIIMSTRTPVGYLALVKTPVAINQVKCWLINILN